MMEHVLIAKLPSDGNRLGRNRALMDAVKEGIITNHEMIAGSLVKNLLSRANARPLRATKDSRSRLDHPPSFNPSNITVIFNVN